METDDPEDDHHHPNLEFKGINLPTNFKAPSLRRRKYEIFVKISGITFQLYHVIEKSSDSSTLKII